MKIDTIPHDGHLFYYLDFLKDHLVSFGAIPMEWEDNEGTVYGSQTCFDTAWLLHDKGWINLNKHLS